MPGAYAATLTSATRCNFVHRHWIILGFGRKQVKGEITRIQSCCNDGILEGTVLEYLKICQAECPSFGKKTSVGKGGVGGHRGQQWKRWLHTFLTKVPRVVTLLVVLGSEACRLCWKH